MAETPKRYRCSECKAEVNDGDEIDVTIIQKREIYATGYVCVTGRYGPSIEEWDEEDHDVDDESIAGVACRNCGYNFSSLENFLEVFAPVELKFSVDDEVVVKGYDSCSDWWEDEPGVIVDVDELDEDGYVYEVRLGEGHVLWFPADAVFERPAESKPGFKVGDRVIVNYNAAERKAAGFHDGLYMDFEDEPGAILEVNYDRGDDRCSILIEFDDAAIDRWYLPPSCVRHETPPLPPIPSSISALLSRDLPF